MKNILILIVFACCIFYGCSENDRMVYEEKPAVYFADLNSEADSMIYSFTTTDAIKDTVYFKVKLLGAISDDKEYKIVVDPESTAKAGIHYVALEEIYVFPAGKAYTMLPVYMMYTADMDTSTVTLSFRLEANDELDLGYLDMVSGRLMITNQLIKPVYWDSLFFRYYGDYSKVKHQICIDIMGHDFPLTQSEANGWGGLSSYAYWMHAGREAAAYFAQNEVYDENGVLIEAWEPY